MPPTVAKTELTSDAASSLAFDFVGDSAGPGEAARITAAAADDRMAASTKGHQMPVCRRPPNLLVQQP